MKGIPRKLRSRAWLLIAALSIGFGGCGNDPEPVADASVADAQDAVSNELDTSPDASLAVAAPVPDGGEVNPLDSLDKCPEPSILVTALRERADVLEERARQLDEREHALKKIGQAIDERLTGLEKTRDLAVVEVDRLADERAGKCREQEAQYEQKLAELRVEYDELEQGLARWEKVQQERSDVAHEAEIERLTKALGSMRPEKAAATLGSLEVELAAMLLSRLPERASGKVLAVMPPANAAAVVKKMLEPPEPAGRKQLLEVARNEPDAAPEPEPASPGEEGTP